MRISMNARLIAVRFLLVITFLFGATSLVHADNPSQGPYEAPASAPSPTPASADSSINKKCPTDPAKYTYSAQYCNVKTPGKTVKIGNTEYICALGMSCQEDQGPVHIKGICAKGGICHATSANDTSGQQEDLSGKVTGVTGLAGATNFPTNPNDYLKAELNGQIPTDLSNAPAPTGWQNPPAPSQSQLDNVWNNAPQSGDVLSQGSGHTDSTVSQLDWLANQFSGGVLDAAYNDWFGGFSGTDAGTTPTDFSGTDLSSGSTFSNNGTVVNDTALPNDNPPDITNPNGGVSSNVTGFDSPGLAHDASGNPIITNEVAGGHDSLSSFLKAEQGSSAAAPAPIADDRSWWQRNAPTWLGGATAPVADQTNQTTLAGIDALAQSTPSDQTPLVNASGGGGVGGEINAPLANAQQDVRTQSAGTVSEVNAPLAAGVTDERLQTDPIQARMDATSWCTLSVCGYFGLGPNATFSTNPIETRNLANDLGIITPAAAANDNGQGTLATPTDQTGQPASAPSKLDSLTEQLRQYERGGNFPGYSAGIAANAKIPDTSAPAAPVTSQQTIAPAPQAAPSNAVITGNAATPAGAAAPAQVVAGATAAPAAPSVPAAPAPSNIPTNAVVTNTTSLPANTGSGTTIASNTGTASVSPRTVPMFDSSWAFPSAAPIPSQGGSAVPVGATPVPSSPQYGGVASCPPGLPCANIPITTIATTKPSTTQTQQATTSTNSITNALNALLRSLGIATNSSGKAIQPVATLVPNPASVSAGASAQLLWTSSATQNCTVYDTLGNQIAAGGSDGSVSIPSIQSTSNFTLRCVTTAGTVISSQSTILVR